MKIEKTLEWLTPEMEKAGATKRALLYINGLLPFKETPDLTWREFIFIWTIQGEKFEKSNVFKKRIAPFKKADLVLDKTMLQIIGGLEEAGNLFRKYLPVPIALKFCQHFYHCIQVWDRAKAEEKHLILEKIRDTIALETLDRSALISYYNMAKDFPVDRAIATVLINTYIQANDDGYRFSRDLILSDVQLEGICKKLEEGKSSDFDRPDMLMLYAKTKSPRVIAMISTVTAKAKDFNFVWLLNDIKGATRGDEEEQAEKILLYFPITTIVLKMVNFQNVGDPVSDVLRVMPPYNSSNKDIVAIVARLINYYKEHSGTLYSSAFEALYNYVPDRALVDIRIKNMTEDPKSIYFQSVLKAFEISKEEQFLCTAVCEGLILKDQVSDDISLFLDWLKSSNSPWYKDALKVIEKNKLLEKWWRADKGYTQKDFAKIAKHFL